MLLSPKPLAEVQLHVRGQRLSFGGRVCQVGRIGQSVILQRWTRRWQCSNLHYQLNSDIETTILADISKFFGVQVNGLGMLSGTQ